jgi:hypothetical protein
MGNIEQGKQGGMQLSQSNAFSSKKTPVLQCLFCQKWVTILSIKVFIALLGRFA